jgi:hypothetical protein
MPVPSLTLFPSTTLYPGGVPVLPPPPPPGPIVVTSTQPRWIFVVADNHGVSLGELRAYERTFQPGVSKTATAGVRLRQDDELWSLVAAGDTTLKVYNTAGLLQLWGPIVADEEQADGAGATVKVTAADLSWELARRYVGKDTTGRGLIYTNQDSGVIAFDILAQLNAEHATGITAGQTGTYVHRDVTYLWKRALDALSELGASAGSYEWILRYVDGSPPSVFLDLVGIVGGDRTTTVFLEYGTGKRNCKSYGRVRTIDQQATRVWALGAGSTQAVQAYDDAAEAAYSARREDVLSFGDIGSIALLDSLAAAHVAVRKDPRQLVSLTAFAKSAPKYGVDYTVGDRVSARVVVNNVIRVAGAVRVWNASIAIDELGNEQPELALVPD